MLQYYTTGSLSAVGQVNLTIPATAIGPYVNFLGTNANLFRIIGSVTPGNTVTLSRKTSTDALDTIIVSYEFGHT